MKPIYISNSYINDNTTNENMICHEGRGVLNKVINLPYKLHIPTISVDMDPNYKNISGKGIK